MFRHRNRDDLRRGYRLEILYQQTGKNPYGFSFVEKWGDRTFDLAERLGRFAREADERAGRVIFDEQGHTETGVTLELVKCVTIPDEIEVGKIYYTPTHHTTTHICPCGCRMEVPIPTRGEDGWKISVKEGKVTLSPSLEHRIGCRSHYRIRDGRVLWCNDNREKGPGQ